MYIKEELQSTLISMLVETGQHKGAFLFKLVDHLEITDLKYQRVFACECGYVLSHLVGYSMKVELTGS